MFGALAHGLPQVVLPQAADNFVNAEMVVRVGAARMLAPSEVTEEAVTSAVRAVLTEPSYQQAARLVAAQIAAMPSAETLADRLRSRT